MGHADQILDQPVQNEAVCPISAVKDKSNQSAEASRFQRFFIALSCILAVFVDDPRFIFPLMVSTVITLLTSTRFEPSVLIYRYIITKIFRRDLWKISEHGSGKYLLGNSAEKFIFTVMGLFLFLGIYLQHSGAGFWVIPVAMVGAGMSLAATTGICFMGLAYIHMRKIFTKSS
jgi:hypothetical protein